jgi:hypothetical protein
LEISIIHIGKDITAKQRVGEFKVHKTQLVTSKQDNGLFLLLVRVIDLGSGVVEDLQ